MSDTAIKDWIHQLGVSRYIIVLADDSESRTAVNNRSDPRLEINAALTRQARAIGLIEGDQAMAQRGLVFTFSESPSKRNLLLTWASGKNPAFWKSMRVFAASANETMPDCYKVVMTHDMPLDRREWLQSEGFRVWDVTPEAIQVLIRDRSFEFSKFLKCFSADFDRVLISDCKDVLFQRDLFRDITWDGSPRTAYLFSEGATHEEIPWNFNDQKKFQAGIGDDSGIDIKDWKVINGGVIFGALPRVAEITHRIAELTLWANSSEACSDQAALNYLYRSEYDPEDHPWLIHPKFDSYVAHGDAIKNGVFEIPVHWTNEGLSSEFGPFSVFHQWDRTIYHDDVMRKYGINL